MNYVIHIFETQGRNKVFHFRFGALEQHEPFPDWDDTFFDIHSYERANHSLSNDTNQRSPLKGCEVIPKNVLAAVS